MRCVSLCSSTPKPRKSRRFLRQKNAADGKKMEPSFGRSNMNCRTRSVFCCTATFVAFGLCTVVRAQMTSFTKAQVADRIRKVEDGVDEFRKYLENRGEDAKGRTQSAQSSGATRRGRANST